MDFLYYTFLLTFLIFPIIALILCKYFQIEKTLHLIKPLLGFFLFHNALFVLGFSLKGDYVDYLIFSVEYLFVCYLMFGLKLNSLYVKIFKVIGVIGISIGFIVGTIGILMFIVIEKDYEAYKIFRLKSLNGNYETRQYVYGFATSANTRYTFETYREYTYLPFEKKIDKTNFFDDETNLNIGEEELQIIVQINNNKQQILFKDHEGNVFSKLLE